MEFAAKQRIGSFLEHQGSLGRLKRPVVSPLSLSKTILKLARKKVGRRGAPGQDAILAAGLDVLDCYVASKHAVQVGVAFEKTVTALSHR